MTESAPQIPEYVAVECPVCCTRMHARPARAPGQIKCPDCYTLARVPSISEVLARLPRQRAPEVIGTYDLGPEKNPNVEDPSLKDWPSVGAYHLDLPLAGPGGASSASAPSPPGAPVWFAPAPPPPESPPAPATSRERPPATSPAGRSRPRDNAGEPAAASTPAPPQALTVACPACGAEIEPPSSEKPTTILCPECLEDVPVPARAELPARRSPQPQGQREPGRTPTQREHKRATRPPTARRERAEPPQRSPSAGPAAEQRRKSSAAPPPAAEPIEFDAAPLPQPPRPYVNVFDAMAAIRQETPDPPPRWTFFSSVFEFPWRPDMLARWIYLTLGFTVLGLLMAGLVLAGGGLIALVVFFPVLVAAAGLTLSYGSACFIPILVDTAAGNDRVTNWFDSYWKEWTVQFMYLVCMLLTAGLFGHLAGLLAELGGGPYGLVLAVTIFLAFPIVLLSSQEANSPFIPLTRPILKSLVTSAWVWLMFYALSALVVGAAAALIALGTLVSPFLGLIGWGPVLATVFFIYPRLLGRLAWRASLARPRRRKRRHEAALPAPSGGIKRTPAGAALAFTVPAAGTFPCAWPDRAVAIAAVRRRCRRRRAGSNGRGHSSCSSSRSQPGRSVVMPSTPASRACRASAAVLTVQT